MNNYTPVDSKLFDRLRATATLNQECRLNYLSENDEPMEVTGKIVDVYSDDEAEWCKLNNDSIIRLDKIENFETVKA
jgi:Rho-binding antiterminator